MKNIAISLFISIPLCNITKATCYPQGPCRDGFMDISEGHLDMSMDCYGSRHTRSDCPDGQYIANLDCECACIVSDGCSSETAQSDRGLPGGAIAGIVIGSLIGAGIVGCIIKCLNSPPQPAVQKERDVGLLQVQTRQQPVQIQTRQQKQNVVLNRISTQQLDWLLTKFNQHGLERNGTITVSPQVLQSLDIEVNGWESTAKGLPIDFTDFVRMKAQHPEFRPWLS